MDIEKDAEAQPVFKPRWYYETLQPLLHLLTSNDPPSDPELRQLAALGRDMRTGFEAVTAGTTMQEERLRRYDPLGSLRTLLKGATSLIRRLPDELISEIFLMCLPFSCGVFWNTLELEEPPWNLTRVCQRWRAIALGDQRLWCSIDLDASSSVRILTACLARSGKCLLAIHNDEQTNTRLLSHLSMYSERWRHLHFILDFDSIECMERIKGRLPELQKLSIHAWFNEENEPTELIGGGFIDTFRVAPKLQDAEIYHPGCHPEVLKPPAYYDWLILPWHQLKVLQTDSIRILSHCDQATYCYLTKRWAADEESTITLTLPNLRILTVLEMRSLGSLVLPSLESMTLDLWSYKSPYVNFEDIRSLVFRSSCVLKHLNLGEARLKNNSDLSQFMTDCHDLLTVRIFKSNLDVVSKPGVLLPDWHLGRWCSDGYATYRRKYSGES